MLQRISEMLHTVEKGLRSGLLTPAPKVEAMTLVCFTENAPHGRNYHQYPFEEMPEVFRREFKDKVRGDTLGQFKIVAIYDIWPPTHGVKDLG